MNIRSIVMVLTALAFVSLQPFSASAEQASCHRFQNFLAFGYALNVAADIFALQEILIQKGYLKEIRSEGEFTKDTREALKKFQDEQGVDKNGVVGADTRAILEDLTGCERARGQVEPAEAALVSGSAEELTARLLGMLSESRSLLSSEGTPDPELAAIIHERKSAMEELAKTNPAAFLATVMPEGTRRLIPQSLQGEVEQGGPILGTMEVFHIDDFAHPENARFFYLLNTSSSSGGQTARKSLNTSGQVQLPLYPTEEFSAVSGTKIRFKKAYRLLNIAVVDTVSTNDVEILERPALHSVGEQKTLVLLLQYANSPAPPFNKEEAKKLVFENQVQSFYKEQSYNQVSFAGDVYGWFTLDRPPEDWCETKSGLEAIPALLRDNDIDLSRYKRVLYLVNVTSAGHSCSEVGISEKRINEKRYSFSESMVNIRVLGVDRVIIHEMGHALGLWHANGWFCRDGAVLRGDCLRAEAGNPFDSMGLGRGHFNAFYKNMLGWLPPSRVATIRSSGHYVLAPLGSDSGIVLFTVDNPVTGEPFLALEHRQSGGFEVMLDKNKRGILVNTLNPPTNLLVMDQKDRVYPLTQGKSWTDPEIGLRLGPVGEETPSGISFEVTMEPPQCVQKPFRVQHTSISESINAGERVSVGFTIVNEDSLSCPKHLPVEFSLFGLPETWKYVVYSVKNGTSSGAEGKYLDPGESMRITIFIEVPPDAKVGEYNFAVDAIRRDTKVKQSTPFSFTAKAQFSVHSIEPSEAKVGQEILVKGSGFSTSGFNEVDFQKDTLMTVLRLNSPDGSMLRFTVPEKFTKACRQNIPSCPPVLPGVHLVTVYGGNSFVAKPITILAEVDNESAKPRAIPAISDLDVEPNPVQIGKKLKIQWKSEGVANVKIDLLNYKTRKVERVIEEAIGNAHKYEWTVPDDLGDNVYRIRVSDASNPSAEAISGKFDTEGKGNGLFSGMGERLRGAWLWAIGKDEKTEAEETDTRATATPGTPFPTGGSVPTTSIVSPGSNSTTGSTTQPTIFEPQGSQKTYCVKWVVDPNSTAGFEVPVQYECGDGE